MKKKKVKESIVFDIDIIKLLTIKSLLKNNYEKIFYENIIKHNDSVRFH